MLPFVNALRSRALSFVPVATFAAPTDGSARGRPSAPVPSRGLWLGDIRFGYDQSGAGAVPAGSRLPAVGNGEVYCLFSWCEVPAGSRIGVWVLWGSEAVDEFEFPARAAVGQGWVSVISFSSPGGGGRFSFSTVTVVLSLDGKEMARGGIPLE